MAYSIRKLANLSGISTRTLRYYEEVGLLLPAYKKDGGQRFYGEQEVDKLQQILYYKERGFELKQIKKFLTQEKVDTLSSLEDHLTDLHAKKERIEAMIENLMRTIQAQKGYLTMTTSEKFQAFKDTLIQENETKYGTELRERYGDEEIQRAKQHFATMSEENYQGWQAFDQEIKVLLQKALAENWKPEDERSKQIVQLHKEWLQMADKHYSAEKHIGIAQLYTADERFSAYYDEATQGCAAFLTASISYWAGLID
ncbi:MULTISPECIES: MerR family transcriptional regulator [unclassified Streptococcus]|uniref:MerR family transcriptional regulator n=1 Tax=unclassified Streptococcus TaxID=2608887 RepID=UPI0010723817|nr:MULTISPECIES: MerR family transcriptional regulator [unclassified Streptococcus]MBF0786785.1 MerR family transcriptional regulator [Streptococcus sp. 19428wC2_LYSM12]MCQ9211024.1 MerR family transcriptional regulator [Streptococcus sp. B01]MCQ9214299.1 MerR family transcriptional regulator [Streptococcus sp. O1]TFV06327.1 MerR family transcriptional regulator [Streptococcus sp. LYSM12]